MLAGMARERRFEKYLELENALLARNCTPATLHAYLDELLGKQEPCVRVLRLVCLWSVLSDGLTKGLFERVYREIVQAYGIALLPTLMQLDRARLLTCRDSVRRDSFFYELESKSGVARMRTELRVLGSDRDAMASVYSGYLPVSVRIVQQMLGCTSDRELRGLCEQTAQPGAFWQLAAAPAASLVLVFVGGCTLSEAACFRMESHRQRLQLHLITTGIITASRLLEPFIT